MSDVFLYPRNSFPWLRYLPLVSVSAKKTSFTPCNSAFEQNVYLVHLSLKIDFKHGHFACRLLLQGRGHARQGPHLSVDSGHLGGCPPGTLATARSWLCPMQSTWSGCASSVTPEPSQPSPPHRVCSQDCSQSAFSSLCLPICRMGGSGW